jgi:hypothetical protein
MYSRAGPRWDTGALRAVAADDRPAPDGWISFQVEAPGVRRPGAFERIWAGRIHGQTGRIELTRPQDGQAPQWRPLAEVLKDGAFKLPRR